MQASWLHGQIDLNTTRLVGEIEGGGQILLLQSLQRLPTAPGPSNNCFDGMPPFLLLVRIRKLQQWNATASPARRETCRTDQQHRSGRKGMTKQNIIARTCSWYSRAVVLIESEVDALPFAASTPMISCSSNGQICHT